MRLASEDAGEADWLAFTAWLDSAPDDTPELHRAAFDRAQKVWLDADALPASPDTTVRHRAGRPPSRARLTAGWGLAAAAGLAIAMAGLWVSRPPPAPAPTLSSRPAVFATASGERRRLVLADGSKVELDGGSVLEVEAIGARTRQVSLQRGEATFDVVHDPARPFTVVLGQARVRVLGTAFDVLLDPGLTQVSVARGVVALDTPHQSVRLPAGRGASWAGGRLTIREVASSQVGAWRNGRRAYWGAPLGVVVADLNRTYVSPIRLDGAAAELRFTGVLGAGSREQTVRRLTALLPLQATNRPHGAIVLTSRRN